MVFTQALPCATGAAEIAAKLPKMQLSLLASQFAQGHAQANAQDHILDRSLERTLSRAPETSTSKNAGGSRRLRIWDLPADLHCSIIGVCFSISSLRNLVARHFGGPCVVGDYQLHHTVVQACRTRTALVELVQRELDSQYQRAIRNFHLAKSQDAVAELWQLAVTAVENPNQPADSLAGALWASLSHPRTGLELRTQVGHDIHMIQHRVGTNDRHQVQALQLAQQQASKHLAELDSVRAKQAQLQAQHLAEMQNLQGLLTQTKVALAGAVAQNADQHSRLIALRDSVEDLESRQKLTQRVTDLTAQNATLKEQLGACNAKRLGNPQAALAERPSSDVQAAVIPMVRAVNLGKKSILCVGGRSSSVASYRKAVEQAGGSFFHHDGGREHGQHRLGARLAAADCVVCQTGNISHTAYWLVKDYCKKTGKHCVYLEKPSVSCFVEGLSLMNLKTCDGAFVKGSATSARAGLDAKTIEGHPEVNPLFPPSALRIRFLASRHDHGRRASAQRPSECKQRTVVMPAGKGDDSRLRLR